MTERARRIVLASRPVGEPTLDNFRLEELPIPQPGPGQMLLRTRWLSLDHIDPGSKEDIAVQLTEGWILGSSPTIKHQ
jgi:NADPH-dependent curcumin reductase